MKKEREIAGDHVRKKEDLKEQREKKQQRRERVSIKKQRMTEKAVVSLTLGSLRCRDGHTNENVKKTIG